MNNKMQKIIFVLLLLIAQLFANDVKLDIRATYVNYNYDKGFPDAEAFATSLKIKYEYEVISDLKVGIAFGSVQDLGIMDYDKSEKKRNMTYMFNKNNDSYSLLHQAYLRYEYSKSFIEIGRFELETPLLSSNDSFALSNSFQGVHADITEIDNYTFKLGYISKMSGAWDVAYDGGAFESMTKQVWAHRADTGSESYYNLVDDLGVDDAGTAFIGAEYKKDSLTVQFYNHMFIDAYNSLFGQVDYILNIDDKELCIAGQYIKYDGIGTLKNNSDPEAVVDYATYSAKAQLSSGIWKLKLAYTGVSDNPSIHFFGTAGAYPEFASGIMVSYFEGSLRDANIFSLTPSFKFVDKKNIFDLSVLYAYFDLNSDYTKGGTIGDSLNGDSYLQTYGVSCKYTYDKRISWLVKLAQRRLEHGDENLLFRTILGYSF